MMKTTLSRLSGLFLALTLLISNLALAPNADAAPVKAQPFSGVTVDGRNFNSSELAGKACIVNFFATWCPPCRSEIPDMVAVQKKWEGKGFTFVGIAVNEQLPSVKKFMKSNGMTYPVLMATPALIQTFNRYIDGGITGIPTSFVIDASGQLTGVIVGPRSGAQFDQIISTATATRQGK